MKVLVTHGSKRGGTAGIASRIGDMLREAGIITDVLPAKEVRDVSAYDGIVIGGALYAMLWSRDVRRLVLRHAAALRERHVWFFSSGPLDDSASSTEIPPTPQVQHLMEFVGARGHATFGGRLAPDARGFVASKMARRHSGDWRDPAQIEAWARDVAKELRADIVRTGPRPPRPVPKPLPPRLQLVALCLFAGVTAMLGGAALVMRPDGSSSQMPPSMLAHSPFHDFLVPGLLLLIVVGLSNAWAALLHLVRSDLATPVSFVSGNALVVWIVVEMIMLRSVHWLHVLYLVLGGCIVAETLRFARSMLSPPRPPSAPTGAPAHG